MNKKIIVFLSIIVLLAGVYFIINKNYDNKILNEKPIEISTDNRIYSIMLETGYKSSVYNESTENSFPDFETYKLNQSLSKCKNGSQLSFDEENLRIIVKGNTSDECSIYFDKIPKLYEICLGQNFGECISLNYELDSSIYYHNSNLVNGANDNSYRYAGNNPNNYVCFVTCDEENLYQVIGVFNNQIKLIKYLPIENIKWDSTNNNIWWSSSLNQELNTSYLNGTPISGNVGSITLPATQGGISFKDLIYEYTWNVGGCSRENCIQKKPSESILYEIGINSIVNNYTIKLGLMYINDYAYAASPSYWEKFLWHQYGYNNYSQSVSENWLFNNENQWTMTRTSDDNSNVYYITSNGVVSAASCNSSYTIRPTMFLNTNVKLINGKGTKNEPFILN